MEKNEVQAALKEFAKEFGAGVVSMLGSSPINEVARFSTGIISLDHALGGGIPRGRIVEIYGPESSGKTTLCTHFIGLLQKQGERCAFVDMEHAFDPIYAQHLGVVTDDLLFTQPDSGEQCLQIIEKLLELELGVIVVDSIAAMTPIAEIQGEYGAAVMGSQARMLGQGMRKLTAKISKSKTTVIFTNQIRQKIGVVWGSPEVTTGGNAIKFYASVRMDIRRIAKLEKGTGEAKSVIGNTIKVKVIKNKTHTPYKEAKFDLMFETGISVFGDILESAIREGIVERAGAMYRYKGDTIGKGREATQQYLKDNPEVTEEIKNEMQYK